MSRRHPSRDYSAVARHAPDEAIETLDAIIEASAPTWKATLLLSGSAIGIAVAATLVIAALFRDAHAEQHKAIDDRFGALNERVTHVSDDIHEIKDGLRVVWRKNDAEAASKLKDEPDASARP